jgi:hypothetical protein
MPSDVFVDAAQRHALYFSKAQEAVSQAERCEAPEVRLTWLEIAASWRYLADRMAKEFKL